MDCVLLEVELAVELLSTLQEQEPTEPAVGIVLGWELPVQAVVSGLETHRSYLELVQEEHTPL